MRARRLAAYLILLAAAVTWASFYGGALPYTFLYMVLLVPVASGLYLMYVCQFIRFYQNLPSHRVTKGEMTSYRLSVENTGPLPFVSVTLLLEKELCIVRGLEDGTRITLMPGERMEFESELICRYSGAYNIGIRAFDIGDCFHLFILHHRAPTRFRVIVSPRITDAAGALMDFEEIRNQMELQNALLSENISGNELREYREGDSLKRVHWKNSARAQKLLVRRPEPRQMQELHIVMIPAQGGRQIEQIRQRDRFLELAVSMADYFCTRNKPVTFHYPKGGMQTRLIDSYGSFREFYTEIPDELDGGCMEERELRLWLEENWFLMGGMVLLLYEDAEEEKPLQVYRRQADGPDGEG